MDTVISTMTDPSESQRVSDVMEKYTELNFGQVKNGADGARLPCLARTFGDIDQVCGDFRVSASQEHPKDFLKTEPGPWEDITDKAFPLKETPNLEITTTDARTFIKDERKATLITAPPRATFDILQNIDALVSTSSFASVQPPPMDSGAGVVVDIPQAGALVPLSQIKPEAAVALGFDSAGVCKSELGGWDPHQWFSSALAEERAGQTSFMQRSSAVFSAFPG